MTTSAQLQAVKDTVAETGRIFSICFSERHRVLQPGQWLASSSNWRHRHGHPDVGEGPHPAATADAARLVLRP